MLGAGCWVLGAGCWAFTKSPDSLSHRLYSHVIIQSRDYTRVVYGGYGVLEALTPWIRIPNQNSPGWAKLSFLHKHPHVILQPEQLATYKSCSESGMLSEMLDEMLSEMPVEMRNRMLSRMLGGIPCGMPSRMVSGMVSEMPAEMLNQMTS